MQKRPVKIFSIILAFILAISLAGCLDYTYYYPESVSSSTETSRSAAASTSYYAGSGFDIHRNPYYAMLSETEKRAYSFIYDELSEGNDKFECPITLNAGQLAKAVDAVLNDHPELFWIDNDYVYSYDTFDYSVKEISFNFFDFADTPEKLAKAKSEFESAARVIVSKANRYTSIAERELYIHDYICDNTEYDETAPYNQSAYSVIVLHKSVCAGYSRGFQYLMQKAGYTCYYVMGKTDTNRGQAVEGSDLNGSHSWNIVLLGGQYYNVDCLWDDTASEIYGSSIYPFFNVTDEALIHHERIQMAVDLPQCKGMEYKYSNQFGPTVEADSIVFSDAA